MIKITRIAEKDFIKTRVAGDGEIISRYTPMDQLKGMLTEFEFFSRAEKRVR